MVTLSSCLIWQIISFNLPPNEYGCVYTWTTLGNIATDRLGKKSSFQMKLILILACLHKAKLSHLGHRKPARIPWKADAPWILVQRHNWAIFLRKWARRGRYRQWRSLSGHVERIFVHKNWRGGILTTFCFNWTALRATQPKLHSMFCALFLKIALSAAELMSFGHLRAVFCYPWTIICGVPSKISVKPTSQRQLTL